METIYRDVLIIGAGISGCSTAIRLLQNDITPLIVDMDNFPRDTVGEGLSPAIGPYLKELGILERVNNECLHKASIQLISPSGHIAFSKIDFAKDPYTEKLHDFPWGFNVKRKHFDMIFQERAIALGAEIWLKTKATDLIIEDGKVVGAILRKKDGQEYTVRAKLVIDCGGRGTFIAKKIDLRGSIQNIYEGQWGNMAVRAHFDNIDDSLLRNNNPDYETATVSVFPYKDCWYWYIPLDETRTSVGFVARAKKLNPFENKRDKKLASLEIFHRHPILRRITNIESMADDLFITARLGHLNKQFSGDGFICVGDAAFFADPAWGTGVTISLISSKLAAAYVTDALKEQNFTAKHFENYDTEMMKYITDPFNSIRAYNYYYTDSNYIDYIVKHMVDNPHEMDIIGAVLFDYASHTHFREWSYRVFKDYFAEYQKMPIIDKVTDLIEDHV